MRTISFFLLASLAPAAQYTVRAVAGSDWIGDGGPAHQALLLQAEGLATCPNGSLYVSDAQTHRVRQIAASGIIQTVAGTGVAGYSGDGGPASAAQLSAPYGLACDSANNLYVADLGNRKIRRIGRDGTIATVAPGLALQAPRNVAVDAAGHLYVSDFTGGSVYRIANSGTVSLLAILKFPAGLAVSPAGALHIGETGTHQVRKLEGGVARVVASVNAPTGLSFDAQGTLYIADATGGGIFRVPPTGTAAPLLIPARDLAAANGAIYSTDGRTIRRIVNSGNSVIAGQGSTARGDGGPATEARLNHPASLALDASGNLFIADRDNHRVRRIDPAGIITTIAGNGLAANTGDGGPAQFASVQTPSALSLDAAGNLYIAAGDRIRTIAPNGRISTATAMPLPACVGGGPFDTDLPVPQVTCVLRAPDDRLYVADMESGRVWELTPQAPAAPEPVTELSLVNAAGRTGPLAPGMLAAIEGVALDAPEITFGGIPALVLSSTTFVVPPDIAPGMVDVEIRGVATLSATVVAASPALFVAVNEDGSVNDAEHPAEKGSVIVLYGTGQGVEPAPVSVRIAGHAAEVLYSGPVDGFPGLWQVNARVPGGFLPPGSLPLSVSVGSAAAPPIVIEIK